MKDLGGIGSGELRRQAAKQQLALAAQQLLQDPEKEVSQLKGLLEFVHDEDPQVRWAVQVNGACPSPTRGLGRNALTFAPAVAHVLLTMHSCLHLSCRSAAWPC